LLDELQESAPGLVVAHLSDFATADNHQMPLSPENERLEVLRWMRKQQLFCLSVHLLVNRYDVILPA
jgi:hypothetical protein